MKSFRLYQKQATVLSLEYGILFDNKFYQIIKY